MGSYGTFLFSFTLRWISSACYLAILNLLSAPLRPDPPIWLVLLATREQSSPCNNGLRMSVLLLSYQPTMALFALPIIILLPLHIHSFRTLANCCSWTLYHYDPLFFVLQICIRFGNCLEYSFPEARFQPLFR